MTSTIKMITASGSNNGWHYTKFSDGMFIACKVVTLNTSITAAGGGGYYSDLVNLEPLGFNIDTSATAVSGSVSQLAVVVNPTMYADGTIYVRLWRGASVTIDGSGTFTVIGKWTS